MMGTISNRISGSGNSRPAMHRRDIEDPGCSPHLRAPESRAMRCCCHLDQINRQKLSGFPLSVVSTPCEGDDLQHHVVYITMAQTTKPFG